MFFGGGRKIKKIFYIGLIIAAMFLSWNIAQMETETGNIDVQMNVGNHCDNGIKDADETGVDCGGSLCESCGGCSVNCNQAPRIYDVASSTTMTSAKVTWKIDDYGYGLKTNSIVYSEDNNFASTTAVSASGTEFVADILGLKSDTVYNFKIIAINNDSPISEYSGQFKTQGEYLTIYNVVSSTNFSQAIVGWEVDFKDVGPNNTTSITYGKTSFSSTTVVIVSGTEFIARIDNLEEDTVYNFEISATNNSLETATYLGQFKTQKGVILNSLTILAKPEKRVPKPGGNFGATAYLLFFDSASNAVIMQTSTMLSVTGETVLHNIEVPVGTNFSAILKTTAHLAKRITGVNTTALNVTLDFTDGNMFYLKAGDLAGSLDSTKSQYPFFNFLQGINRDEFVDVLDLSAVVAKVISEENPDEIANLNKDGIVDVLDISVVLENLSEEGNIMPE